MPYQETADDLHRKWVNSFCLYEGNLFHPKAFAHVGGNILCSGETEQGVFDNVIKPEELRSISLPNGLYNIPIPCLKEQALPHAFQNMCWTLIRSPKRSPMHGINYTTYRWINPLVEFVPSHSDRRELGWRFSLLRAVMSPEYINYHQALKLLTGDLSIAVNRKWGVCLNFFDESDTRALFLSSYGFVGWAYPDRIEIKHRGSFQEALDFVRQSRLDVEVIYAG